MIKRVLDCFKVLNRSVDLRNVYKWILIIVVIGVHLPSHAADDDKQPVSDAKKEKIVDEAKKKEDSPKADVGEASYNVQDCETAEDGKHTDKENVEEKDKDNSAKAEKDSADATDDLDECAKMVK